MNILVTGSSGFLGSALVERLTAERLTAERLTAEQLPAKRHEVRRLLRPPASAGPGAAVWDPGRGLLDPECLEWTDAVIHLAGAGVGAHRWTSSYKQTILQSRTVSTRLLSEAIASAAHPPQALLIASAIGFYGDRGDEVLTEASAAGSGFRAQVCQAWEAAAQPAAAAGVPVVPLRFGIVLGGEGGMLPLLLRPARCGLRMQFGSGGQFVSWVSLADAVDALGWVLHQHDLEGPINVTAPLPVTNAEFARSLAQSLHRNGLGHIPGWALRAFAGSERANEVFLSSQRAVPTRLLDGGFSFGDLDLAGALQDVVESPASRPRAPRLGKQA